MKKELIFLGPPASGKGTQTSKLAKEMELPHVDTGSMLRAAIKEGTPNGLIAKGFIDKGQLVTTEIVAAIIKDRLLKDDCSKGFILDGYPRNIEQADILEVILAEVNAGQEYNLLVINIEVDESILLERIVNRRSCEKCGEIYNLKFKKPAQEGICECGGVLIQRKDDTEETAKARLETYHSQTAPLIDYYSKKGLLKNVDGNAEISKIYEDIKTVIEKG